MEPEDPALNLDPIISNWLWSLFCCCRLIIRTALIVHPMIIVYNGDIGGVAPRALGKAQLLVTMNFMRSRSDLVDATVSIMCQGH